MELTSASKIAEASGGKISFEAAYAMASINIEKLMGVDSYADHGELVATSGGGLLSFEAKVFGIISPRPRKPK